ncbi:prenyltransferase/squalene oxidase repeat-containing protein [Acanthopleuribacter pedis]|uniref:Prenyltransferase alpha-alpha toroid domain-containing protein n=1 Tax=Acanthopleuribacter pedis TaxID=442870 RepID=A0A8J7QSR9_9BACT|nr:prenyltransferase/squalene oxidase repeat-containing protein [Acanthopleuribacter pedis]MBO1323093.1 hypothetical protein [Acanthopleuribacter pedis]
MLQTARLAPRLLSDAASLVAEFTHAHHHQAGGFADRAGDCDLYYTVFGLGNLLALQETVPAEALVGYLQSFGSGEDLDLIHRCALIRAWAGLGDVPAQHHDALAAGLERYRSADGGFNETPDEATGSAYGAFLAVGAYQDLNRETPHADRILASVDALRTQDGGFGNYRDLPMGTTPAFSAAENVKRALGQPLRPEDGDWLLNQRQHGGFLAVPGAPMPDLLSTAVALFALTALGVSLEVIREPCLDYIDSLWVNRGAFYGNWGDDILDCEYTFYGLLALGCLAL